MTGNISSSIWKWGGGENIFWIMVSFLCSEALSMEGRKQQTAELKKSAGYGGCPKAHRVYPGGTSGCIALNPPLVGGFSFMKNAAIPFTCNARYQPFLINQSLGIPGDNVVNSRHVPILLACFFSRLFLIKSVRLLSCSCLCNEQQLIHFTH